MPRLHCFVDESIHDSIAVIVTAFIFADSGFSKDVAAVLASAGLNSPLEEFKSRSRMDADARMRVARDGLLSLAASGAKVAVYFGPNHRPDLGRQTLQALQSVLVRNAIPAASLTVYCDQGVFPSPTEAARLVAYFHALDGIELLPGQDSRTCVGIQVADAIAHSFGQIVKAAITGHEKLIDLDGGDEEDPEPSRVPLSWSLLMTLRRALLTRPVVSNGDSYLAACDPVVLDPESDDYLAFALHPSLLGWGAQIAPDAKASLRQAIERELGQIWLGCIS